MSKEGSTVDFFNFHKQQQLDFVIHADFKFNLRGFHKPNRDNLDNKSYTDKY